MHSPGSPYSATGLAIWYLGQWFFRWGCGFSPNFDLSFLTFLLPTLIHYQDFRQKNVLVCLKSYLDDARRGRLEDCSRAPRRSDAEIFVGDTEELTIGALKSYTILFHP